MPKRDPLPDDLKEIHSSCKNRKTLCQVQSGFRVVNDLLVSHGADHRAVCCEQVISSRNPYLIRWFIERGLDVEEGCPIAHALRNRRRDFLGIYMDIRDRVPSARKQAAMALRVHCREGNLRWVSLLLWAGVDPRAKVPDMEWSKPEQFVKDSFGKNRAQQQD